MKLWRISQSVEDGYDSYDSAVVVAPTEDAAKRVSPSEYHVWHNGCWHFKMHDGELRAETYRRSDWANDITQVTAELIGTAARSLKAGEVVCASFNAG